MGCSLCQLLSHKARALCHEQMREYTQAIKFKSRLPFFLKIDVMSYLHEPALTLIRQEWEPKRGGSEVGAG